MMKILKNQNGTTLEIALEGRLDTTTAPELEKELKDSLNDADALTLDFSKLDYISSAGLRVLMKLRKKAKKAIPVENVSPEVYDIFDVTGFTDLLDVHKALRKISVDGCEMIGQGGNGSVYRLDQDTIVKVYKPWMTLHEIQRERDFARTAFINGIPSVIAYDVVKFPLTKENAWAWCLRCSAPAPWAPPSGSTRKRWTSMWNLPKPSTPPMSPRALSAASRMSGAIVRTI